MTNFRCRKHRQGHQELWQISVADGVRAARVVAGPKDGDQVTGGWVREDRSLAPGLYCKLCLKEGSSEAIPDYDEQDLIEAGLNDPPHIGLTAADFSLDET